MNHTVPFWTWVWVGGGKMQTVKKRELRISWHLCEQIATIISRGADNDRLWQLYWGTVEDRTQGWGGKPRSGGHEASPEAGVARLQKMKLSRLLAVSVNTCHVHCLFLMPMKCIMTQWGKPSFIVTVKHQMHPTSSKQEYIFCDSVISTPYNKLLRMIFIFLSGKLRAHNNPNYRISVNIRTLHIPNQRICLHPKLLQYISILLTLFLWHRKLNNQFQSFLSPAHYQRHNKKIKEVP